ncbi:MAG TPA: hypothetical protein VGB26_14110 [Nitrospiria bacterium]|jgi:hypothetical protein
MSDEVGNLEAMLAKETLSKKEIYEGLITRFIETLRGYHKKTGIDSDPKEVKTKIRGYMESAFKEVGVDVEIADQEQFEKVKEIVDYEIQLFRIDVVDGDLSEKHNQVCEDLIKKFPS